jgi:hypothetical protein
VLKAKYFLNKNILQCIARDGISYSWRSILWGTELLKEGIIWRIGNGNSVNIWSDPWLPRGVTRRPATPKGRSLLSRVSDLIDPNTGAWDEQLIYDTFWSDDAETIMAITTDPLMLDWTAWHYDSKGIFSVKSAYKLAVQIRDNLLQKDASSSNSDNNSNGEFKWHKIWQLKLSSKIKMFTWRLAHNSLPVRRNLVRRGVKLDTICPVCNRLDEDCAHLFFKCKKIRACWQILNLEDKRQMLVQCKSGIETIDSILQMEQNVCQKILILLWVWWSVRNKANRGEKLAYEADICSSVMYHLKVSEKLQDQQKPARQHLKVSWIPPPEEFYKINVDASFHVNDGHGSWGFVIRNHEGIVLQAGAGSLRKIFSPLHDET